MTVMYSWRTRSASRKGISKPVTMEIEPDRGGNDAWTGWTDGIDELSWCDAGIVTGVFLFPSFEGEECSVDRSARAGRSRYRSRSFAMSSNFFSMIFAWLQMSVSSVFSRFRRYRRTLQGKLTSPCLASFPRQGATWSNQDCFLSIFRVVRRPGSEYRGRRNNL